MREPDPTEPADYTGFRTPTIERTNNNIHKNITMYRNARLVVTGTIITALGIVVTTTMKFLLSLGISEEVILGK
jgi:hypothetical protein